MVTSINTSKVVSVPRTALSGALQGDTDLQRPQGQPHTMARARLQEGPCWQGTADKTHSSNKPSSFSYVTQGMLLEMANLL